MSKRRRPIAKLVPLPDGRHEHWQKGKTPSARRSGVRCAGFTLNGKCCRCGVRMVFKKK